MSEDRPTVLLPLSNQPNLTAYVFYQYLIPALHSLFVEHKRPKIVFDLVGLRKISPIAVAGLLSVGEILVKTLGEPVELRLEWNSKLLAWLFRLGFFKVSDQQGLFFYDDRMLGGFDPHIVPGDAYVLLRYDNRHSSSAEASDYVSATNPNVHKCFGSKPILISFLKCIGELMHNSVVHGEAPCYACAVFSESTGLESAVSDIGIGFHRSFLKHLDRLSLYSPNEFRKQDQMNHLRAIFEGVYRRFGSSSTYGLSSLIREVTTLGGTVRIHSDNTQVVFTEKNYRDIELHSERRREFVDSFARSLWDRRAGAPSTREAPLRIWNAKLTGVHAEFTLPSSNRYSEKSR